MKTSHHYKQLAFCLGAALLAIAGTANAQIPYPNIGTAVTTPQELFANGGDVTVTFLGRGGAVYTDLLFLNSPANGFGTIFNNQTTPANTTMDLGNFATGTEMQFGIQVLNTQNTWLIGPGSRNSDGTVHAYLQPDGVNTTYVGFEDLDASVADFNYTDVQFTFTGLSARSAPDAASTLPLLGMSLAGLMAFARRFRK
jgi:hypothetical protein